MYLRVEIGSKISNKNGLVEFEVEVSCWRGSIGEGDPLNLHSSRAPYANSRTLVPPTPSTDLL